LVGTSLNSLRTYSRTELLRQLVERQREVEAAVVDEVDRLAALGVGWGEIGAALGVSRQAARQHWFRRHGRR
jgi:hypothetical protein